LAEWCSYSSNKGGMVDSPVILEILAVVGFTVSSVVVTAIRICVWFDRAPAVARAAKLRSAIKDLISSDCSKNTQQLWQAKMLMLALSMLYTYGLEIFFSRPHQSNNSRK
jgi:hypothetical protein